MAEDNQQNDDTILTDVNLDKLQSDLQEAMNGWKRTAADFENYKKRKEQENKELVEFAREVTVAKLLPALDSLEQALKHMPAYTPTTPAADAATPPSKGGETPQLFSNGQNRGASPPDKGEYPAQRGEGVGVNDFAKQYSNWQTGVTGIVMQLDKTLAELGVKKIEAIGKKFDPHFHEAVKEVESDQDDGIVVDELQSGFELNGKLIRPSQVVISKKKN